MQEHGDDAPSPFLQNLQLVVRSQPLASPQPQVSETKMTPRQGPPYGPANALLSLARRLPRAGGAKGHLGCCFFLNIHTVIPFCLDTTRSSAVADSFCRSLHRWSVQELDASSSVPTNSWNAAHWGPSNSGRSIHMPLPVHNLHIAGGGMAHTIPQLMSPNIICQWPEARRRSMCVNRVNPRPRTTPPTPRVNKQRSPLEEDRELKKRGPRDFPRPLASLGFLWFARSRFSMVHRIKMSGISRITNCQASPRYPSTSFKSLTRVTTRLTVSRGNASWAPMRPGSAASILHRISSYLRATSSPAA
ncbi:hypothetical protein B0T14DRAFT_266589 [Immersiella caudata]|uniref:Uncharacterized protein n=1 Tax=Immersiella caudata TaxID=314043 RepID=A0AA39WL03_9PEZI|nr:hypothetical protein B0T14DRAFT_266589 [Immersiella caudata]